MLVLLDTSEDLGRCAAELQCDCGQLLTPLTRFRLQCPVLPWAMDNGAFSRFDEKSFRSLLQREEAHKASCLFVACPDVVGSARRTLEVFAHWRAQLMSWPLALVAQDGQQDLPIPWDDISAVFIGGSTDFKVSAHAEHIIRAGKILGKWVHVGRVNTPHRFEHFEGLGVDSVDGSGIARFSHMRESVARRNDQQRLCL